MIHALRLVLDPSLPDTARQLAAEDFWDGLPSPFDGHDITIAVDLVGFDDDREAMVKTPPAASFGMASNSSIPPGG